MTDRIWWIPKSYLRNNKWYWNDQIHEKCESVSRLVVYDPMDSVRLLCRWDSPGNNTGLGCPSLLQGIFPTQVSNLGLLHCRQILYHLSHQGSPYGIWGKSNLLEGHTAGHQARKIYWNHTAGASSTRPRRMRFWTEWWATQGRGSFWATRIQDQP